MPKNSGGPAFPGKYVKHKPGEVGNQVAILDDGEGLSKREYFAAAALQGLLASGKFDTIACRIRGTAWTEAVMGEAAVDFADATLKALQK